MDRFNRILLLVIALAALGVIAALLVAQRDLELNQLLRKTV